LAHYVADEELAITPADVFHSWNLGRSQHCRTEIGASVTLGNSTKAGI